MERPFLRVEGFVFAHVADEGLIESSAGSYCDIGGRLEQTNPGVRQHQKEALGTRDHRRH
jgi:hypothetical protein